MLVHDPYKLISGPYLSTDSRINNSYEKEMTHKREGSAGLLCTNNSMGFPLKYDPCPQVLLYHSWESSIPDNLHDSYSSKVHTVWLIFSASRAHLPNSTPLVIA